MWYIILYHLTERSEFFILIFGVFTLGAIYFYWVVIKPLTKFEIIGLAILFRVVLLFGTPNFSDDFNRFIWDGKVSLSGGNPYELTPTQMINKKVNFRVGNIEEIYSNLNSKNYYTVYPPVNQVIFAVSEFAGNGNVQSSVLYMKLFILLFEIGLIFLLFKMLRKLKLKESLAQIYALNPLVIIELTGNVHFEGIMLFFFMLGLWFLLTNKIILSGLAIALAVNTKIVPLLFLPLFLPLLGLVKSVRLYASIAVFSILMILPFLSETLINNFGQSLELYFQSFEFNASFYYLVKGISHYLLDYKTSLIGSFIPIAVFLFAIYLTYDLYRKNKTSNTSKFDLQLFISSAVPLMLVFYLLASTIHPWYIINLLVLCVFIPNKAIMFWSILIFLSYFAYSNYIETHFSGNFHDSNWYYFLTAVQYILVLTVYFFDKKRERLAIGKSNL